MHAFSVSRSPTSTVKRSWTIWSSIAQFAETMLTPLSANARDRSSSRCGRSQASTAISTRKDCWLTPPQETGVNRSGFRFSARAFGQSSRWIVMPRPREM